MARKNSLKARKERHEGRLKSEREARAKRAAKLARAKAKLDEKKKQLDSMDTSADKPHFEKPVKMSRSRKHAIKKGLVPDPDMEVDE